MLDNSMGKERDVTTRGPLVIAVIVTIASSVSAQQPRGSSASKRPIVSVVFKDGAQVKAVLLKHQTGFYTVKIGGKALQFREDQIESITFPPPADAKRPRNATGESIEELIGRLRTRTAGRCEVDESVIALLAVMGADAIKPLLAEVEKDSDIYQAVGKIFKQMGPEILPTLIAVYSKTPTRSSNHPIGYVLRAFEEKSEAILIKMLGDSSVHVRRLAIDSLYDIGIHSITLGKGIEQPLFDALGDSDSRVRQRAPSIIAMLCANNDAMVPTLIGVLKTHRSNKLRRNTVLALGSIAGKLAGDTADLKNIVDALSHSLLNDSDTYVRATSASCLGRLGPKARAAVGALRRASDHKNQDVRAAAREALRQLGATLKTSLRKIGASDQTVDLILRLAGKDRAAAREASNALAKLGPETLDALMVAVRHDKDNYYWPKVAHLLGIWDKKVFNELDKYVADEHYRVRRTVAMGWGRMRSIDAIPKGLPKLLHDEHSFVRTSIVDTLIIWSKYPSPALQKAVLPLLIGGLFDEGIHYTHRWTLYSTMSGLAPEHPEIISAFIKLLKQSTNCSIRGHAAPALGDIARRLPTDRTELPAIVQALAKALARETDSLAKRYTIGALASIGPSAKAALPALQRVSDTSEKYIAQLAKDAMAKIEMTP